MSDLRKDSQESVDSISKKQTEFYSNNPTQADIEKKIEELEIAIYRIPELDSFLKKLLSLPWNEYEERLSLDYYNRFPFGKDDSNEPQIPSAQKNSNPFSVQEPGSILEQAREALGSDHESLPILNNYVSNLIARTMARSVSIAVKKHLKI
ncbi:hypothetical protein DLM76_04335 [Leptospira yasudae]|uniref:DUF1564 domain-containing protein n=1 Tax=Leptospira yasudae TaxID=2202201 RepID=A0ABX9M5X8_9LEPT|nr:hypothetical protein [Leptospira yasudae]RHX81268.1 hypothetical protein DLM77_03980 [Leptospira yasudae]RHX96190.1 hypothetical protein DLM76_04335 [Leptospira yasudae]TGK30006.1 hypothetical protein EHQ05_03315 [Leptospira yasudae]TGM07368.1 hypothetical protein EHQ86_04700 [Leptospira yasudae]